MKKALLRFARAVRTNTISGALFALPAIGITLYLSPDSVGYLLISTTAMILYVSAQRVNQEENKESILENIPENQKGLIVLILLLSTLFGITAQLGAVVGLTDLLAAKNPLLAIVIAVFFPFIDRQLGEQHWILSIASLVSMLAIWIILLGVLLKSQSTNLQNSPHLDEIRNVRTLY